MIQADVYAALNSIFSGHLYPLVAPDNTPRPFGVYQRVSSVPVTIHANGTIESRIQIDIYADTYAAALTLADSVRTTLAATTALISAPILVADEYEPDTKLFRVLCDFSFWHLP